MNKKLAVAVTAVVIFGGGVAASIAVASAQTGSTTTSTPAAAAPEDHPDHGAAQKSALDPLVADGTITQEQEDKVLGALDGAHQKGPGGPGQGWGFGRAFGADLDSIASTLGITTDQLTADLKDGKSLADIAGAQGVDVAKVEQVITDAANAHLDDAVKSGKLTQDQADKIKAETASHVSDLVNGKLPFGGPGGPGKGHGPFGHGHGPGNDDDGSSGTTTTTTN